MELKKLDLNKTEHKINGKDYIIYKSLSVNRFQKFIELENEVGFGVTFEEIQKQLSKAIQYGNSGKGIEGWTIIKNMETNIAKNIEKRYNPAMMLLMLFVCYKDEDISQFDETIAKAKIEDLNTDLYDVNDLFSLALNLVRNFIPVYNEILTSTSENQTK